MREKVTDSWRWSENGVTKKLYATLPTSLAEELAAPAATAAEHCVTGWPKATVHRLSFVVGSPKRVRTGLGRKADFSYWQCYEGQVS
jgi:hypothetical protein